MKNTILFPLLFAAICHGEEMPEPTTRVWESADKDGDGKADTRIETTLRGKSRILRTWHRTEKGVTKVSREFIVGDDTVLLECDEDGDGTLETIVIYDRSKNDFEAFTRQPDGSVRPLASKALAALKEQHAAIDAAIAKFWDDALGEKADVFKFPEAAKELQKKLNDAEEKKKESK